MNELEIKDDFPPIRINDCIYLKIGGRNSSSKDDDIYEFNFDRETHSIVNVDNIDFKEGTIARHSSLFTILLSENEDVNGSIFPSKSLSVYND